MSKCKLIAEAGSSKIDWVVVNTDGSVSDTVSSDGINALMADAYVVNNLLLDVKRQLSGLDSFSEIHYYGAGCATPRVCDRMKEIISGIWQAEQINVCSDLLAAARALFGKNSGIACILGTGSNSCLYDGKEVSMNIPALGYILGDEGSGASLGKRLVGDAFKRQLPEKVCEDFMNAYDLSLEKILENVYRSPAPNKFLASLVPFLKENLWNPYIYSLVLQEFSLFFRRNVAMYPGARRMPVSFVGGLAAGFENVLREAAASQGFTVADVIARPLDRLVEYHALQNF